MTTLQNEDAFSTLLRATPSTLPQSRVPILLEKATAVVTAERIARETSIRSHHTYVSKRTIDEEEAEEREWDRIVSKPHVRQALRRMAAEARRQYYAGETEEGGFALE